MNSIRPLATITLLACVGVVLYLKISETEQSLPPGLEGLPAEFEEDLTWSATGGEAPPWTPPAIETGAAAAAVAPAQDPFAGAPFSPGPGVTASAPPNAAPGTSVGAQSSAPSTTLTPPLPDFDGASASPVSSDAVAARASSPAQQSLAPEIPDLPPLEDVSSDPVSNIVTGGAVAGAPEVDLPTVDAQQDAQKLEASSAERGATDAQYDSAALTSESSNGVSSLFTTAWLEVQAALDRGDLSQALLKLSDWYGDPSLSQDQEQEVDELLGQLAGSVIYEGPPAHRLEPPYRVGAEDTLMRIGDKFAVPWQLLAKINGISNPQELQPGQELKVLRGPFSAVVDLSERELTLMLDRRYAGRFPLDIASETTLEEGQWKVDQKLLTPTGPGVYGDQAGAQEDRSLVLSNLTSPNTEPAVLRGPGNAEVATVQPRGRLIRLERAGVEDVFDILSVGSRVIIRR